MVVNDFFGHQSKFWLKNDCFRALACPKSLKQHTFGIGKLKPINIHQNKIFEKFSPQGVCPGIPKKFRKMAKLPFFHVFGHFIQCNYEKTTKIKVILEICLVKFKKSTNNPGGNPFYEHHRGSNAKILSKIMPKNQFFAILTLSNLLETHKNYSRQTRTLYGYNESGTSTDRPYLCTPREVKFTYFDPK